MPMVPGITNNQFPASSLLILLATLLAVVAQAEPRHVYLTWQSDTSRTMTVNYQNFGPPEASTVYYDTKPREGRHGEYRYMAVGNSHQLADLADERKIHWVELENLTPGETYYFIAGDPRHGFTAERKFRTIPADSQKLRFVTGGDMGIGPAVADLLQHAAKLSPDFGVVGGDIAYANDALTNYTRWDAWLDHWQTNMVTPAGYTVPMVLAIGNHETKSRMSPSPTNAQFYFRYFAQTRDQSFYSRTFGKNLVLFLIDSGHVSAHDGEQAVWLDAQMTAHRSIPHRFAVYHVPLYPSVRPFDGGGSVKGRESWLPIFDKHHLTAAFENHDHAFKRTHLLRENKPDPRGTLFLGDGCWGMSARPVSAERRWYELKAASIQHFWQVDVSRSRVEYRAINKQGKVFDVYPPNATGAKEAEKVYATLKDLKP